jgi:hypothetical protein
MLPSSCNTGRDKSASLKWVNPAFTDMHCFISRICQVLDCLLSIAVASMAAITSFLLRQISIKDSTARMYSVFPSPAFENCSEKINLHHTCI